MVKAKTAVIYARFSSDLQKDRSVEDQAAICEQLASREGYKVIEIFSDRAKSGASMFERDGLLALMTAAKKRSFDAVIVESLDRLSRDQEDLAGIFKRLKFSEIKIITCNEGETTDIHVGIRGIVGSLFLADLGAKVRRGHNGRVREGKFPGTVTYGYRRILGKPGEREIDPDQAAIVRRVFTEYAEGKSTRQIAADLTRDGIPTPSGGKFWNHQTFTGGRGGKRGMIGNQLYIGKLVWNANRSVLNPETGKKLKRRGKADDVIVTDVPHLRIIEQELWDRANGLCSQRAESKFGPGGKRPGRVSTVKGDHLLSGLLSCGACGGHMRIAQVSRDGGPRVACAASHQHGTCDHRKSYDLGVLEATVLSGVKRNLTDPRALAEYTKAYHARWNERQKEVRSDRDKVRRALDRATVQIDRIVSAIADTDQPVKVLTEKLRKLEAERVGLAERLRLIDAENGANVVSLHPVAIEKFAASIEQMHDALTAIKDAAAIAPFRAAFRNVFERIVVHPTGKRMPYEVTPYARLSAILGIELFPKVRTTAEMLAEQGVVCTEIDTPAKSVSS